MRPNRCFSTGPGMGPVVLLGLAGVLSLVGCPGGEVANRAPNISPEPPETAPAYERYVYDLVCADLDGDMVTLTRGASDTCEGELTDHGNRTATYIFDPDPRQAGTDCVLEVVCDDGELQDTEQAVVTLAVPTDAEDLTFAPFELWAEPIADYISEGATALQTWDFYWGIHDLAVHDHRLYIGYGDATHNVGSLVPIEIRSWQTPDPDAIGSEFVTDEEQISRYRQINGRLLAPGVDAAEDNLLGQIYSLDATGWNKDRTIRWAWHVEDVTIQGDDLIACGSGGTLDDYADGTVNAYLYRRTPDATGFEVDTSLAHPDPPGDHRLTNLLVVGDDLYATGYWSDYSVSHATAFRYTGAGLEPWDDMASFYVTDTLSVAPDLGLVFGVAIAATLRWAARVVTPAGVTEAMGLAGLTPLNVDPLPDGRALLLVLETDVYPSPSEGPWDIVVGVTSDGQDFTELARQSFDVLPRSIAFWRRSLYLGLDDGTVWRAWGTTP
jgi:hypothetical protein